MLSLTLSNARFLAVVYVVLGVLVSHVANANQQRQRPGELPERVCYHSNINRPVGGGFCGPALTNAMSAVCALRSQGKRSVDSISTLSKAPVAVEKKDAMRFLTKRDAFSNIYCECCYNRCSISELQEYC